MPRLSDAQVPSYRLHKQSGQGIVTLNGRDLLLGKYGSRDSREAYHRLIIEWMAAGRQQPVDPQAITVAEVASAYCKHAKVYYRRADGTLSSEIDNLKQSFTPLLNLYSRTPAVGFGPLKLKAVREAMIAKGWVRKSVNKHVERVRRMFKWAVENEMIPPSVFHGLQAVAGLRAGRCAAKEGDPVLPVPVAHVEAVIGHLSPQVATMVRLQLLTGMRPGETCIMRTCDIDTTGKLWVYTPAHHKTAHHGHKRAIYLGPKAQELLRPFLKTDLQAFLFVPREAEQHRRQLMHAARKTPIGYGNAPGTNRKRNPKWKAGDRYNVCSYRHAIVRACAAAFRPPEDIATNQKAVKKWHAEHRWHPHQLRHTAATELRKQYGLEAAQVILGHKNLTVTEIYAEKNVEQAMRIMSAVG